MNWVKISLILCMFGCLKDFRPSESFVTDYLVGSWKNFTRLQVNQEIYPVSTYSYFATLVIVFLITDFVRYKPIIILCGISGALTFLLILVGKTIFVMQIVEFLYGIFLSAEVAYYTYIYAKVDKKHYQEVTGHTKAASLIGRCMAGIIAQLTTSLDILDYHQLNYLTVSAFVLATIWALFLPPVGQSIYFHRPEFTTIDNVINTTVVHTVDEQDHNTNNLKYNSEQELEQGLSTKNRSITQKIRRAYFLLWKDFIAAYTNFYVVKWSCWWAFSTCGYLQVTSYAQILWQTAVGPNEKLYNGAVDSIYAIIGAVTVFCIGRVPFNWPLLGDGVLLIVSLLEGAFLILCSYSYDIWWLYAYYIMYGVIYHTMVTVASFEVAKYISEDSYGLIFGVTIFFALLLQTILTMIVQNTALVLDIRAQFYVYGAYFIVLGLKSTLMTIITVIRYRRSGMKFTVFTDQGILNKVDSQKNEKPVQTENSS